MKEVPTVLEMSGDTEGTEEWGVSTIFLRASPGLVRNASPPLPSKSTEAKSWVGPALPPHRLSG